MYIKDKLASRKKKSWLFTHRHVIQDVHVFLSSVAKEIKVFEENIKGFLSIKWTMNGSICGWKVYHFFRK